MLAAVPLRAQSFSNDFDHIVGATAFNLLTPHLNWGPTVQLDGATYEGGVILRDVLWLQKATSGTNILASCDTCFIGNPGEYYLPGAITITFDSPRDQLDLDVINGVDFMGNGDFVLRAFDENDELIGTLVQPMQNASLPGGKAHVTLRAPAMKRVEYSTELPEGHTFALDSVVHRSYESVFTDLGAALPGGAGAPELSLFGSLVAGELLDLELRSAAPNTSAIPVLGTSAINAAFKQGVMVPAPEVVLPAVPVNSSGDFEGRFTFPAGVPAGFTLYLQLWIADPSAPAGYAASNALSATTPPS
ncbi:MAG: hypothetical protein DHS20C15_07750 [Planctomycetota bacterium]|nr:MAG: hypothetical protein DHS20C15_07750 [Planctomycetota bacterium]